MSAQLKGTWLSQGNSRVPTVHIGSVHQQSSPLGVPQKRGKNAVLTAFRLHFLQFPPLKKAWSVNDLLGQDSSGLSAEKQMLISCPTSKSLTAALSVAFHVATVLFMLVMSNTFQPGTGQLFPCLAQARNQRA